MAEGNDELKTYNFVSLPADRFRGTTAKNLDTPIPGEIAPSNTKLLFNNRTDYNYPGIAIATSLPALQYKVQTKSNLNTPIPGESSQNSQIFSRTMYYDLSFEDYPNAFRNSHSATSYSTIPEEKNREDEQSEVNSEAAKDKKIDQGLQMRQRNHGQIVN